MSNLIHLRRKDTGTAWGFRLGGGIDMRQPLFISKVIPNSLSQRAGLAPGDLLLQIGMYPGSHFTHGQAKQEILRAGNELDFIINRTVEAQATQEVPSAEPRGQVVEEHLASFSLSLSGQSAPAAVKGRSFKVLQMSLPSGQ